jgi:ATP-binding cassette, subfamily B, bacterial
MLRSLEHGLDTLVGPRGVKLSGGQIQRAAAARMFVRDDITCLVVSHRPAALAQADQVLTLERGRLDTATAHDFLISS